GGIDHLRSQREPLKPEGLSFVHQQRRRPLVDFEDESRSAHESPLGSNAILSVPRRPAANAWSRASRHRASGYTPPTTPSSGASRARPMARSRAWTDPSAA